MKKTSILSIFLVFLASILLVGFFGNKIQIYDEEKEVESIEWVSAEYENNENFKVVKYSKEDKEKNQLKYDAQLFCFVEGNVTITIKCICLPTDATNTNLVFYADYPSSVSNTVLGNGEISLSFTTWTSFKLNVKSS